MKVVVQLYSTEDVGLLCVSRGRGQIEFDPQYVVDYFELIVKDHDEK